MTFQSKVVSIFILLPTLALVVLTSLSYRFYSEDKIQFFRDAALTEVLGLASSFANPDSTVPRSDGFCNESPQIVEAGEQRLLQVCDEQVLKQFNLNDFWRRVQSSDYINWTLLDDRGNELGKPIASESKLKQFRIDKVELAKIKSVEKAQVLELRQSSSDSLIVAASRVLPNTWLVGFTLRKNLLRSNYSFLIELILAVGLLLSFSAVLARLLTEKLLQPLRDLLDAMRTLASGKFEVMLPEVHSDEFGQIAKGFNFMTHKLKKQFELQNQLAEMDAELNAARTVQMAFLPSDHVQFRNWSFAGHYEPAAKVGGDWWHCFKSNGSIVAVIGDVTGHGLPSAMLTGTVRAAFSIIETQFKSPAKSLELLNRVIFECSSGGLNMTMVVFEIDLNSKTARYCNASHEPILKLDGSGELLFLSEVHGPRLGQEQQAAYSQTEISIDPSDCFFAYTDGILSLKARTGKIIREREIFKLLQTLAQRKLSPQNMKSELSNSLSNLRREHPLEDDLSFFFLGRSEKVITQE